MTERGQCRDNNRRTFHPVTLCCLWTDCQFWHNLQQKTNLFFILQLSERSEAPIFADFCWGNLAELLRSWSLSVFINCVRVNTSSGGSPLLREQPHPDSPWQEDLPQQSVAHSISTAHPKFLHKPWTPLCLWHRIQLPPKCAAAWSSCTLKHCAARLMQSFHPFWLEIGLQGRNAENNGNGAFLNNRIHVHLILAKSPGLSGYNSPCSCICFNLLMHNLVKVIFFSPSLRLLHEWELQSGAHRKSNTTRCVPSGSSSSNTHKGGNGNKWKHSSETLFLLHQDHWLCDARDDFWDTITESRGSFDIERTRATWFSHCKCKGSHGLGLFCGGFLIN